MVQKPHDIDGNMKEIHNPEESVRYRSKTVSLTNIQVEILDSKIQLSSINPFGAVSGGKITIRGKMRRIVLARRGRGNLLPHGYVRDAMPPDLDYPSSHAKGVDCVSTLYFLPMVTSERKKPKKILQHFLLLKLVEGSADQYTRVGI
jgi:hypothetical protein